MRGGENGGVQPHPVARVVLVWPVHRAWHAEVAYAVIQQWRPNRPLMAVVMKAWLHASCVHTVLGFVDRWFPHHMHVH